MIGDSRTVTTAVGHGKQAARSIDAWLGARAVLPADKHEIASFEMLRIWYHAEASKRGQSTIDIERRRQTFDEVVAGLATDAARYEAQRCLSCGNCFECDGCLSACPEAAIIKLGPGNRYAYDFDKCTGCAICYDQCPCGAITMVPEPAGTGTVVRV